jgi:nucleoside-diphosphate-sugar epimerase
MARVLIAGCGFVGTALGELLVRESHAVWGLSRRPLSLPAGVQPIDADVFMATSLVDLPPDLDCVYYLVAPSGSDDAVYRAAYVTGPGQLLEALRKQGQRPVRFFLASSTAVYAQDDGSWVDETSPTEPQGFRGRRLLEGEQLALAGPFPATVVRFGGIYGPRRTRLIDQVRAGRAVYSKSPRYTNRIHRDDCAGVLCHLAKIEAPEPVYLGVDSDPAPEAEVLKWLAGVLGAPEPRKVRARDLPDRSSGNKRCRNQRLLSSGYSFRYPSFREGYRKVVEGQI